MSVITINESNFKESVINSKQTVVLDFYADWCGPCKMFAPVLHKLAEENPGVTFGKINVDEEPALAQSFKIQSIPTVVIIKDGTIKEVLVGLRKKDEIEALIK